MGGLMWCDTSNVLQVYKKRKKFDFDISAF